MGKSHLISKLYCCSSISEKILSDIIRNKYRECGSDNAPPRLRGKPPRKAKSYDIVPKESVPTESGLKKNAACAGRLSALAGCRSVHIQS